jgi:hypothetical protein
MMPVMKIIVPDYIIRKSEISSGLYNPKRVNHPVESQQKGVVNDGSRLYNPECAKPVRII